MRRGGTMVLVLAAVAAAGGAGAPVHAQALDREALMLIRETVDAICGELDRAGFKRSAAAEGKAEAALSGLAGQLLDLGVEGAGRIDSTEYANVLQEELGDELKDIRACRLKVWDDLLGMLAAPQQDSRTTPPPRDDGSMSQEDADAFLDQLDEEWAGWDGPGGAETFVGDILPGQVMFGPFLNCTIYNPDPFPVTVTAIHYGIDGAYGYQTVTVPCAINCMLGGFGGNVFSGPANSPAIYGAECWGTVLR